MALDEILQDLLSKAVQDNKSPGAMATDPPGGGNETSATGPESLILALEHECRLQYKDPGAGIHFIGLLLAVFAAEIVSGYWAKNAQRIQRGSDRGPARLVSCLFSEKAVAFVLAHPGEVVSQFLS